MVARESIEAFRAASSGLSKLATNELAAFFATLNMSRPEAARDALLEFVPVLVAEYGQIAAALAMEWYDDLLGEAGEAGWFAAAMPPTPAVVAEQVEDTVRFFAGKLWTPDPESALSGMSMASDKYVKQFGRDTVAWNADREGVAWARVPTGATTCSWCLILASRDAVYFSEASATIREDGEEYHGDCDCQAVPLRAGDDYPQGYLPDDFHDMYQVARDSADSPDMKAIAAAMRREFPDFVTDGVHSH